MRRRRRHGPPHRGHHHWGPHGRHCRPRHRHRSHKLHRRLFFWFSASIIVTFLVMGGVLNRGGDSHSARDKEAIEQLLAHEVTPVWTDKAKRDAVVARLGKLFGAPVVARNANGQTISGAPAPACDKPAHAADITHNGDIIGQVRVCRTGMTRSRPPFLLGLIIGAVVLWGSAGFLARRMVRPLSRVTTVARDIGDGDLSSRVELSHHPPGEIGELAEAINDMASRLEKQMADQRQLLAAVSHEIRTPLAHMRVIAELARDGDSSKLADLEREIDDVDTLVDQLLASSRIEFGSFEPRQLNAVDVCTRALERANIDAAILEVEVDDARVQGDPMLLSRAVGNLLENAERHAVKLLRLQLSRVGDNIRFSVEDRGPGFDREELDRVFDSFYRGDRPSKAHHGSLGLGLALVRRIAEAHGGTACAENTDHGARVVIDIPAADA